MKSATKLKFSEFVDLILARLYELERESGSGKFFDLNAIANELREKPPQQWVFDAGKVLETRGYAQCLFTLGGGCHAMLTGEGRLFVEEPPPAAEIIRKYQAAPANFIVVSGAGHQIAVGNVDSKIAQAKTIREERKPAFDLLQEIKQRIREEPSLTDERRQDLLVDLATIEEQLTKREPNRAALAALLEPLSHVITIAGQVAQLIQLLNP